MSLVMIPGLGLYPDQKCYDRNRPGWLPYWIDSLTESRCVYGGLMPSDVAATVYERAQYGDIPEITHIPVPAAPKTEEEMSTWTPEQAGYYGQLEHEAAVRAEIERAIAAGEYSPEGRLPLTAEWLDKYKWPLLIAGGSLLLLFVVKR